MANKIRHKKSNTPGVVPTPAQLDAGEIAINVPDGKAFIKKDTGTVQEVKELATTDNVISKNVVEQKGDLIVGTSSGNVARLPIGTNDQALVADSSQPGGVKWALIAAASGGGSTYTPEMFTLTGIGTEDNGFQIPSGCRVMFVEVIGAGGGGGCGSASTTTDVTIGGGGGGAGGTIITKLLFPSQITLNAFGKVDYVCGVGGNGGSRTSTGAGVAGTKGSSSNFGTIFASGGGQGSGGLTSTATASGGFVQNNPYNGSNPIIVYLSGSGGSGGSTASGSFGRTGASGPGGGGGGGSVNGTNQNNSGAGGSGFCDGLYDPSNTPSGAPAKGAGLNGVDGTLIGNGGSGGAGLRMSTTNAVVGTNGGNGNLGAGGGGGGGVVNLGGGTCVPGVGGRGGDGFIRVYCF